MIHHAAGYGRLMIHDAAGVGRIADHDGMGGPRHHPCDARHGPFMGFCHQGGIIGVMTRTDRHHVPYRRPSIPRDVANPHRFTDPWGGSIGVAPWPTHAWWIIDRPIPAASWIIDTTIPAASWSSIRPIPAASWIIHRAIPAAYRSAPDPRRVEVQPVNFLARMDSWR